jgi:endoglucanase
MTWPSQRLLPRMLLAIAGLLVAGCGSGSPTITRSKMVHVEQGELVDGQGHPVRLQSVALGSAASGEGSSGAADLTEDDYQRAADMGFRVARLDIDPSAPLDEQTRVAWLDQQLEWAKSHGLSVVIALTRPTAGAVGDCVPDALWDQNESQDALVAAWRWIAARYPDEPAIVGYDLLHAPSPNSALEQWRALGARLANAIREVDREHLLILEQAQHVACVAVNQSPDESLVALDDQNVLYAFEARGPWTFTTQATSGSAIVDGGSYPSELELGTIDWDRMAFAASDFAVAPVLNPDETNWTQKKHYYSVIKPGIVIAQLNLRSADNLGTVYFDDLKIDELDPNFEFVRTVIDADLEDATTWFLWQADEHGPGVKGVGSDGHRGKGSVTLTGTTSDANLSNDAPFVFPVRQNYWYRVTGWMKGEHSDPIGASMIGLSLWSYDGALPLRNAANLVAANEPFVAWGREHHVPVFVSAFGTSVDTFEGEKGGLAWVSDMLDVLEQEQLSFCYESYRGADFGIYPDADRANIPLVDLFRQRLARPAGSR